MSDRHRVRADETLEPRRNRWPFDGDPSQGIRPIKHEERTTHLGRDLHRVEHRRGERVVPGADVLHVEDQTIEPGQIPRLRPKALRPFPVETHNWQAGPRIVP